MSLSDDQERLEAIGEQLRAKIASKFTASTFLAGFSLAVLTGQIFALWQTERLPLLFPLAVGLVFAAGVLFVDAVIRLDELTMPKRFWPPSPAGDSAGYPPRWGCLSNDDLTNLQQQMIFFWHRLTIVALIVTAAAVLLMLIPVGTENHGVAERWSFVCASGGALAGIVYCIWVKRVAAKAFPAFVSPVD